MRCMVKVEAVPLSDYQWESALLLLVRHCSSEKQRKQSALFETFLVTKKGVPTTSFRTQASKSYDIQLETKLSRCLLMPGPLCN